MKKFLPSLVLQVLLAFQSFCQETVYTPKGHIVDAYYVSDDYTDVERGELDDLWSDAYPNAQLIETYGGHSSTRLFNCHGYAWHVSEGGAYVWIGSGPTGNQEAIYWQDFQDPSYINIPSALFPGGKVSYGYNNHYDHSAVVANPSYGNEWYVSKWGPTVLMRHRKDDCPWWDDSIKYYKLNPKMSGVTSILCNNVQRSYSTDINHMPQSNFNWTKGPYLSAVNGGGIHDSQYTIKGSGNGSTYMNIALTTPSGFTWSSGKSFWAGKFENTVVTGQAAVCRNSIYTYTAQVPGGHTPSYSYSWTYPSNWLYPSKYQNAIQLQTPSNPYYGAVRVSITNICGASGYSGITVYPGSGCGGYFKLYPNPTSDEVNIIIEEISPLSAAIDSNMTDKVHALGKIDDLNDFTVRIYDNQGNLLILQKRTGKKFSVSLNNIKDGSYIVEVSNGKTSYRERLIINRE